MNWRMNWQFDNGTRPWAELQLTGTIPLADRFNALCEAEHRAYAPHIGRPGTVLDFASGIGRVAVFLNKHLPYKPVHFVLADSNTTVTNPRYGWNASEEYYNNFAASRSFCRANDLFNTTMFDVRFSDWRLLTGWPDLIISMLGAGFHWPMEETIERLHAIAHKDTTIVFGAGGVADYPVWEEQHDFTKWFDTRIVERFECNGYPTHEGRVVILKGKR